MDEIQKFFANTFSQQYSPHDVTEINERLEMLERTISTLASQFESEDAPKQTKSDTSQKKSRTSAQIEAYKKNFSKRWKGNRRNTEKPTEKDGIHASSGQHNPPTIYDEAFH